MTPPFRDSPASTWRSPVVAPTEPHFFAAGPQREAIARLDTLIAGGMPAGILLSPSGCGMTTLLRHVAGSSGFGACAIEPMITRGDQGDPRRVYRDLADALRLGVRNGDARDSVHAVVDAGTRQSVRTVWLVDRAGTAAATVARELLDLGQAFSVVLGTDPAAAPRLAVRLGHCPLRIELTPWSLGDSIDFVHAALRRAGARGTIFTDTAIVRLHEIGEGRVAVIAGMAEWALIIAASHRLPRIGPDVVESVEEELIAGRQQEPAA